MPKILGPRANLDPLKKDAKRWLKALRQGDSAAPERMRLARPDASQPPTLRQVQHALAREHGYSHWTILKQALVDRAFAAMSLDELATVVLKGAWDDGDRAAAARIAERHPELAHHGVYTAVAFGDIEAVRRHLAQDPDAAARPGGPMQWEPLLYLAYSRLPPAAVADNAIELAELLLGHGANPNASFNDGWDNPFNVLTGVIGLGEGVRPPHQRDHELAALL